MTKFKTKARPVDAHVGWRIKFRRNELRLSQESLGARVGVSFQQVQKYELGTNRVGGSRLHAIANALNVPVGYFFDGLAGGHETGLINETSTFMASKDGIKLARLFPTMSPRGQRIVMMMVEQLSGREDTGDGPDPQ